MPTTFPTAIDVFSTIAAGAHLPDTIGGRTHRTHHNDLGDAVEALELYLGQTGDDRVARRLAKTTVTPSSVASITFSSIPTGFSALLLQGYVRGSVAATSDTAYLRFNSDSSTIYDSQAISAANTTVAAVETVGINYGPLARVAAGSAPSFAASAFAVMLPGYASAALTKAWLSQWSCKTANATGGLTVGQHVGAYYQTAAIGSITVALVGGNIAVGSTLTLVGIP